MQHLIRLKSSMQANAATSAMVEPHCAALESCATAMESAGIGGDPKNGHAVALRHMASCMRADAAHGKVPSVWHNSDYPTTYAAADKTIRPRMRS